MLQDCPELVEVGAYRIHVLLELLVRNTRELQQCEEHFAAGSIGYHSHGIVESARRQVNLVIENARRLVDEFGITDLGFFGPPSGMDLRTEGYESLKLFAEHVLPVVHDW